MHEHVERGRDSLWKDPAEREQQLLNALHDVEEVAGTTRVHDYAEVQEEGCPESDDGVGVEEGEELGHGGVVLVGQLVEGCLGELHLRVWRKRDAQFCHWRGHN